MPQLTLAQERALEVLEWLFDQDTRGVGRTTVVAIALIRLALRSPGIQIAVRDPTTPYLGRATAREVNRILVDQVSHFVSTDPTLMPHWRGQELLSPVREPVLVFGSGVRAERFWLPPGWTHPTAPSPRQLAAADIVQQQLDTFALAFDSLVRLQGKAEAPQRGPSLWERLEGD